jgi:hypothetical protein
LAALGARVSGIAVGGFGEGRDGTGRSRRGIGFACLLLVLVDGRGGRGGKTGDPGGACLIISTFAVNTLGGSVFSRDGFGLGFPSSFLLRFFHVVIYFFSLITVYVHL